MIDDYKIKKAARQISEKVVDANGFDNSKPTHLAFLEGHIDGFNAGAKWMQEEFLKDLCHPAKEVPQIGRGRILAYSRDCGYRNLYNLYDMMFKTDCGTYQEMWELEVKAYRLDGWIYADELFDLIIKGGKQ